MEKSFKTTKVLVSALAAMLVLICTMLLMTDTAAAATKYQLASPFMLSGQYREDFGQDGHERLALAGGYYWNEWGGTPAVSKLYYSKTEDGTGTLIGNILPLLPSLDNFGSVHPTLNTAEHFAYVNGYPDGSVKPQGNVTRVETAAILFRLMSEETRAANYSRVARFGDVGVNKWYNVYVATLENAGVIVDTKAGGYFRPNEAITRAELAAMLAQFADTKSAPNYFTDVTANYWAANAIAVCAKLGWINGYPDGTFRPDQTVTRAEMMAMINRALERTPKSAADLLAGMKVWSDNANVNAWYYIDVQEATNGHTYTKSGTRETWTKLAN